MKRTNKLEKIWKNLLKPSFYKLEYDGIVIGIMYMTIIEKEKILKRADNNRVLLKIIEDENITDENEAKVYMTNVAIMNRLLGFTIDK